MATSKDTILNKLRAARQPFAEVEPVMDHLPMVPQVDASPEGLLTRFVEQAEGLGCVIHRPASAADALTLLDTLVGDARPVLAWDAEHIPLPGIAGFLAATGRAADPRDPSARVGITGADAGLAATGSLVLISGPGKPRSTSLLPPVHIAVLREGDIVADLESWAAAQREKGLEALRGAASAMVISGPSRTADIAMQSILGMHGPAELHVVLLG